MEPLAGQAAASGSSSSSSTVLPRPAGTQLTACDSGLFSVGKSVDGSWYAWMDLTQERVCLPSPKSGHYTLTEDADGDPILKDGDSPPLELAPLRILQATLC